MGQSANRKGVKFTLSKYTTGALALSIPYVNSFGVELSADRVYATGGWSGARQVGFDDPYQGSVSISTQIIPPELIALGAGDNSLDSALAKTLFRMETHTLDSNKKFTCEATPDDGSYYVYPAGTTDLANATSLTCTASDDEITVTQGTAGQKVDVYYTSSTAAGATSGQKITFNNNLSTGFYILKGCTMWKDTEGNNVYESIKAFKAQPQKGYTITYNGTGDPLSLDMKLDLYEDEEGNVYESIRL